MWSAAVPDPKTLPTGTDPRAKLLAAAGPVFARLGFERATVREICGLAGVNVAAVAYYFGDKFGLYREVFRAIRQRCQEEAGGLPAIEAVSSADPSDVRQLFYEQVRHLLSRMLARDDSGWESQLMMREMNEPTEVFVEMVEESFRPQFDRLVETLAAISPEATPRAVLERLVLGVVGQCLYYRIGARVVRQLISAERLAAEFDVETLARHITAVTLAAAIDGRVLEQQRELAAPDDRASAPPRGQV